MWRRIRLLQIRSSAPFKHLALRTPYESVFHRCIHGISTHNETPKNIVSETESCPKLLISTGEEGDQRYIPLTQQYASSHREFRNESERTERFFEWCRNRDLKIHPGLGLSYFIRSEDAEKILHDDYEHPESMVPSRRPQQTSISEDNEGQNVIDIHTQDVHKSLPRYHLLNRGLVTTQPIAKGESVFQIPFSVMLGAPTSNEDGVLNLTQDQFNQMTPALRKGLSATLRFRSALELYRPIPNHERAQLEIFEEYLPVDATEAAEDALRKEARLKRNPREFDVDFEDQRRNGIGTWFDIMPRAPLSANSLTFAFGDCLRHPSKPLLNSLIKRDASYFVETYTSRSGFTHEQFTSQIHRKTLNTLENLWRSCRRAMGGIDWSFCPHHSLVLTRAVDLEQAVGGSLPDGLLRSVTSWFSNRDWERVGRSSNIDAMREKKEGDGTVVIVPLMDLANHAQPDKVNMTLDLFVDEASLMQGVESGRVRVDPVSGEPDLVPEDVYLCATAIRDIEKGAELTICYNKLNIGESMAGSDSAALGSAIHVAAARDAGSWISTHGFIPRDNPADSLEFTTQEVAVVLKNDETLIPKEMRSKLVSEQLEHARTFPYVQQIPPELRLHAMAWGYSVMSSNVLQLCFAFRVALKELSRGETLPDDVSTMSSYHSWAAHKNKLEKKQNVETNDAQAVKEELDDELSPQLADGRMACLLLLEYATATWRGEGLVKLLHTTLNDVHWWEASNLSSAGSATSSNHQHHRISIPIPTPFEVRMALCIEDEHEDFEAFQSDPWVGEVGVAVDSDVGGSDSPGNARTVGSDHRIANEFIAACTIRSNAKRVFLHHYTQMYDFVLSKVEREREKMRERVKPSTSGGSSSNSTTKATTANPTTPNKDELDIARKILGNKNKGKAKINTKK